MMHTPPDPPVVAWTDDELDEALAELGRHEPSAAQVATVRVGVITEAALADVTATARAPRSRRKRRLLVVGPVAAVCVVGGGVAAATGVFDQQADEAFTSVFTQPYILDPHTARTDVSITTPDGGQAQLWSAKSGNGLRPLDQGRRNQDDLRRAVPLPPRHTRIGDRPQTISSGVSGGGAD